MHTDNAILGQAARHVIVHAGSVVDERMIRQVSAATLRTVNRELRIGAPLRFTPDEVVAVAESMTAYIGQACVTLNTALSPSNVAILGAEGRRDKNLDG